MSAPEVLQLILTNPGSAPVEGAELLSKRVRRLDYHHAEVHPKDVHFHEFARGVELWTLPGGMLLLRHASGKPLHREFE